MENKICTKCKIEKSINNFYFRTDTGKYRTQCTTCNKGYLSNRQEKKNLILNLYSKNLKECGKCKEIKNISEFNNDKQTLTGKTSLCKLCISKKYTKEEIRNFRYKNIYNITLEEYTDLYNNLNGCCEICNCFIEKLYIDHCHITGEVRGLLCQNCNWGLGNFKDNINFLKNAIKYLA